MLDQQQQDAILERVRQIPIFDTLGFNILELDEGRCVAAMPRDEKYDGIFQSLHGGLLMTAADTIACFAILTKTGPEEPMTTTDMNIRFLAPCLTDLRIDARVIKLGRSLCPVAVDLYDMNDKHVAVAQVNYMRLSR